MKTISLIALAAAAAAFASAAHAADLGGNCCADLEERIAELEATSARKGNRKVKLTVSGHVNEAILFWDDGFERNAYQVTNEMARSRFRFVGEAKIDDRWSAGYLLELGVRGANQNGVNQNTDDVGQGVDVRHSAWWINNKDLGKVWVGQTSQASDGITEINLANTGHFLTPGISDFAGAFLLRGSNGATGPRLSATWSSNAPGAPGEGNRLNLVKYETPTIQGFQLSASWGEDDVWDIAARYANEFNGVKVAFGIAYQQWTDQDYGCADLSGAAVSGGSDCDALGLSGSVMHVPTGLYVTGAYGFRNDDNRSTRFGAAADDRDEFWWLTAGIQRKWLPLGNTTIYGEYGQYETGGALTAGGPVAFAGGFISGSDTTIWGVGINQQIEAAAMDLYVMYRHFDIDVSVSATGGVAGSADVAVENFDAVLTGGIIRF